MKKASWAGSILALVCLSPITAFADWPAQGKRVLITTDSFNLTSSVWIFDLPSGDLLVRGVGVGGNSNGYDVQRISTSGDLAPGWPARGASFGMVGKSLREWEAGFTVDDAGFAWMESQVSPISTNQVDTAGVASHPGAPWRLTTLNLSRSPAAFVPAPDGIYAYFSNRLQRMTRSGAVASGWPATGVATINSGSVDVAALPDGAGGVVIMTPSWSTPTGLPTAQRFDGNGLLHAGWPAAGLVLTDDPSFPFADFLDMPSLPQLQPSDASHCFAVWSGPYDSAIKHVKVQRIGLDGAIDPAWPAGALEVVSSDSITGVTTLPDRTGGLYVLWYAHGVPRATHVLADGSFVPGLDGTGISLVPAGASYLLPLHGPGGVLNPVLPYVPADVTADGRLVFIWDDAAIARSIRVRWLLPDLTADPSEPLAGRLIQPNDRKTYVRAVHAAAEDGAYVAWESVGSDPDGDNGEVWMTRLLPSSRVGVTPSRPRPSALALSAARPNPARGAVSFDLSLPDDAPARVELLDVAGRVVRSQSVQGADAHIVSFRDLGSLPPGLYLARVSTRTDSRCVRFVLVR